jgi:hypothetical protein
MNKFLIILTTLAAFALSSVAHAEPKISGFMQQFVGAGDDIDGGINQKFTRFAFAADATTDNGWTVGGSFAIEYTTYNTPEKSAYLPTAQFMYIATDTGTVNIGNTADAVTSAIPRVSAMVPGAGTDGGYAMLFDGGMLSNNGVEFAEAYYADASSKIDIDLPSINGFTVGFSYTPNAAYSTASSIVRANAADESGSHTDIINAGVNYAGEIDGMSYSVGIGSVSGNSNSLNGRTATQANNNDLSVFTFGAQLTMGNIVIGAHAYDNGDSFGSSTDAIKASDSGYNFAMTYNMGNITIGAGISHSELVRGTNAQARATTLTTANAGNTREDTAVQIGVGYDMGGGVNSFLQLTNFDHNDGDHATTEVDPQVLFAGINIGF